MADRDAMADRANSRRNQMGRGRGQKPEGSRPVLTRAPKELEGAPFSASVSFMFPSAVRKRDMPDLWKAMQEEAHS